MAHDIETMAYTGDVPWHGLGVKLTAEALTNTAKMIEASGLGWSVSKVGLVCGDTHAATEGYAVRRDSDAKVLGIVGPGYVPLQNREAFDWFQPFIDSGEVTYHTAGSLGGGTRTWVLAKIGKNGDSTFEVRPGDRVAKFLLLASSHDGSLAVNGGLTPVRVVCRNTLQMALDARGLFKVRHTAGAKPKLDAARESIVRAHEAFSATAEAYKKLAVASIDKAGLDAYVRKVYAVEETVAVNGGGAGARIALMLAQAPTAETESTGVAENVSTRMANIIADVTERATSGKGNTGASFWDAYNGVTERVSWGGADSKTSADKRMNSAWFGAGATLSKRALGVALQTVGA